MTQLDEREREIGNQSGGDTCQRMIPKITEEEDAPLPVGGFHRNEIQAMDDSLGKTDDMNKEITRFRFSVGKKVLYISMGAMGAAVVLDMLASLLPNMESELINNAFEAFKLITMTVLGYIFGSNSAK